MASLSQMDENIPVGDEEEKMEIMEASKTTKNGDSDDSDSDSGDEDQKNEEKESSINALNKEISQNPYMYDNHTERIKLLREIGDLNRLRDARQEMSTHFPLTEELWLDWLRDEITLVATASDRSKVEELFEKAFQDYLSVPVWLEYVQFAIGRMAEEEGIQKVREAFERALASVGLHVSQGANIWEAYREFESAVTAGLMPQPGAVVSAEQEEAFKTQNQRVVSLFKRQLVVPLLDMQSTMDEYKEWLGEDSVDSETQASFDKAHHVLKDIQQFEDQLISTSGSEQLKSYQDLITHEQRKKEPARVVCAFERALKDHCLVAELWQQYTAYLDKLNSGQQIKSGYERALRNCPWSSQLWVNYLLALERQGTEFVKMKEVADKALQVGFSEASDYLSMWSAYCDYLKRRIDWSQDHTEQLETFRLTMEAAVDFMFENYGKDGDPEGRLRQFWAYIEAKFCKNQERSREIWNQLMQEGHGAEAGMWLQYYQLERMFGDNKHCRKILQRALNSVTDWPESITQAYINFEREEGDLEQFDVALARSQAQLSRIEERRAKAAEKDAVIQDHKKKERTDRKAQKKQQQPDTNSTQQSSQNAGNKPGKRKLEQGAAGDFNEAAESVNKRGEPPSKKAKPEAVEKSDASENHGETVQHDPSKDNVTVFISNLDFSLEVDRLKEIFHKCGEITDIRLVSNYKGKSKGFGYVEFSDSNSVLQALRLDREFIDGRPMFVSRCEDRSSVKSGPQFKYATRLEKNKLFIKGLPFTITQEAIETIFKEHGKLKDVRMVTYRNGRPKGIAYVEYENESCATQAVLKADGLQVGEHTISVAISNPPERKTPLSTRMDPFTARTPSLGGGKKETDFRGKARTQVSLVPRALRQQPQPGSSAKVASQKTEQKSSASSSASSGSASAMSNDDFRKMLLKK
ncbi:squamous cell carcinoma antigen recognized by T-cells 3 [Aplysia californica]|uniref:Squamous cell carcinoma antigen recognized by T-cells 3 n=1 Tax=Aplysia californica TaxID=6500 RepID=A0ABM0JRA8_APLCA|nr:squamous cell carcinoma antigen recognized by T-cells 3 [Aplysia californica]